MQFSSELRNDVLAGDITLSVRLWQRPRVKAGGRYRVGPGEIEVDAIDLVPFSAITRRDVRRAGEPDRETLRRRAAHAGPIGEDTLVYRIEFHVVGAAEERAAEGPGSPGASFGTLSAMRASRTDQILNGLWRFEALHPEWTEDEGGSDGWEQSVAWWAVATPRGLVLIDPLVDDWDELDRLIAAAGGCAGVVRTCLWHQRSIGELARRYNVEVWARGHPDGRVRHPFDHAVGDHEEIFDGLRVIDVERADEIALWLPQQQALVFGDAMIRTQAGELRVCPESWTQPPGGRPRLRALLGALGDLPVEHVLVSHGPLVLGSGLESLRRATA